MKHNTARSLMLAVLAMAFVAAKPSPVPADEVPSGRLGGFEVHDAPLPAPEISFIAEDGSTLGIEAFKGRAVLLNLWATWCAPCKHEMPALDRLQARLGGDGFEVVAVSLDRGGFKKPQAFYEKAEINHLALYNDKTMQLGAALGARGMPTTVLFDAEGREIGRLTGPAEWDSDEAVAFLSRLAGVGGES